MTKEEQMYRLRSDLNLRYEDIGRMLGALPAEVREAVARQEQEKAERKKKRDAAKEERKRQREEEEAELEEHYREIWRLRTEDGRAYSVIGKMFGISRTRVASIVAEEQERVMREEWIATCRANSKDMIRIYQELQAEQKAAHWARASASARLFERMFPDEQLPVIVVQEEECS